MAIVKRIPVIIFLLGMILTFSACDSSSVYEQATEYGEQQEETLKQLADGAHVAAEEGFEDAEDMIDRAVASGSKYISKSLNKVGWVVIFVSLLIGMLMAFICSHTAAIKLYRTSITVFIIGIPLIMLFLMYGMAFLSSWFM